MGLGSFVRGVFGGSSSRESGKLMKGVTKTKLDKSSFEKKLAGRGTQEEQRLEQGRLGGEQSSQIERQKKQATGEAPSIAEAELKAATNRSLAQQLAAAKGRRGGSSAARERQLMQQQGAARRDVSEQAAAAKLKERQMAEDALSKQLQTARGQAGEQRAQDINLAQADRASAQAFENLKVQQDLAMAGMQLSANKQASAEKGSWFKRATGISDENCKTKVKKEGSKKDLAKAISGEQCKKNKKLATPEGSSGAGAQKMEAPKIEEPKDKGPVDEVAGLLSDSGEECKKNKKKENSINPDEHIEKGEKSQAEGNTSVAEVVATVLTAGGAGAAASGAKEVGKAAAKEAAKGAVKEAAKGAVKETAKTAAKEAAKGAAKETAKTAAKTVAKEGAKKSLLSRAGEFAKSKAKEGIKDLKSSAAQEWKDLKSGKSAKDFAKGEIESSLKRDDSAPQDEEGLRYSRAAQSRLKGMSDEACKSKVKIEKPDVQEPKKGGGPMEAIGKVFKAVEEFESGKQIDTEGTDRQKISKQNVRASSDKECKQKIDKDDFNPKSFLDALQAYSYEYKNDYKDDKLGGEGRFLSVMAQDLEKAGPIGKSMVEVAPEGHKQVNYGKGFGAILAAQAHLNQRLSELEKKKK